jgi:uncharacterized protein YjiS (DUF1127 family)
MSLTAISRPSPATCWSGFPNFRQFILHLADAAWRAISRSIRVRLQRKVLHELPDDILKDIGLSRGEIDGLAKALVENGRDATRRQAWYL